MRTGVTTFSPRRNPDKINIIYGTLFEAVVTVENETEPEAKFSAN